MNSLEHLAELFRRLPGVGSRQARRMVYHLLHEPQNRRNAMGEAILNISDGVSQCKSCLSFFEHVYDPDRDMCHICTDHARNNKLLLLVQKDADIDNIEASKTYDGMYFVLGGLLPLNSDNPQMIRNIGQLLFKLQNSKINEIIIGMPFTTDGEHTRIHLTEFLEKEFPTIKFSTLGRGMATGSELEYLDPETLKNAIEGRG